MHVMPRGRKPIPDALVDQMVAMRAAGLTHRQIACECGVAISTVGAALVRRPRNSHLEKAGVLEPQETLCDPPQRCPEGHLCHVLPCRSCAFDRLRENQRG